MVILLQQAHGGAGGAAIAAGEGDEFEEAPRKEEILIYLVGGPDQDPSTRNAMDVLLSRAIQRVGLIASSDPSYKEAQMALYNVSAFLLEQKTYPYPRSLDQSIELLRTGRLKPPSRAGFFGTAGSLKKEAMQRRKDPGFKKALDQLGVSYELHKKGLDAFAPTDDDKARWRPGARSRRG